MPGITIGGAPPGAVPPGQMASDLANRARAISDGRGQAPTSPSGQPPADSGVGGATSGQAAQMIDLLGRIAASAAVIATNTARSAAMAGTGGGAGGGGRFGGGNFPPSPFGPPSGPNTPRGASMGPLGAIPPVQVREIAMLNRMRQREDGRDRRDAAAGPLGSNPDVLGSLGRSARAASRGYAARQRYERAEAREAAAAARTAAREAARTGGRAERMMEGPVQDFRAQQRAAGQKYDDDYKLANLANNDLEIQRRNRERAARARRDEMIGILFGTTAVVGGSHVGRGLRHAGMGSTKGLIEGGLLGMGVTLALGAPQVNAAIQEEFYSRTAPYRDYAKDAYSVGRQNSIYGGDIMSQFYGSDDSPTPAWMGKIGMTTGQAMKTLGAMGGMFQNGAGAASVVQTIGQQQLGPGFSGIDDGALAYSKFLMNSGLTTSTSAGEGFAMNRAGGIDSNLTRMNTILADSRAIGLDAKNVLEQIERGTSITAQAVGRPDVGQTADFLGIFQRGGGMAGRSGQMGLDALQNTQTAAMNLGQSPVGQMVLMAAAHSATNEGGLATLLGGGDAAAGAKTLAGIRATPGGAKMVQNYLDAASKGIFEPGMLGDLQTMMSGTGGVATAYGLRLSGANMGLTASAVNAVEGAVTGRGRGANYVFNNTPAGYGAAPGGAASPGDMADANGAIKWFMDHGYDLDHAAAMAANIKRESGFNPHDRPGEDNQGSYGLFQWRDDPRSGPEGQRRSNFMKFAGHSLEQSTPEEQYAYADWELKNSEKSAGDRFFAAHGAEAGGVLSDEFERPHDKVGNHAIRTQDTAAYIRGYSGSAANLPPNGVLGADTRVDGAKIGGAEHVFNEGNGIATSVDSAAKTLQSAINGFSTAITNAAKSMQRPGSIDARMNDPVSPMMGGTAP